MEYNNHIQHYKVDAEYFDFFNENSFRKQDIFRHYQEFFSLYKVKKDDKILEIGAGGGTAVKFIQSYDCRYYPLDISSFNLKKIKGKNVKNVYPVSGDVYALPFENESFDFIILSEVLEHLAEPFKALTEIKRVLKKNGSLIISVPYNEKISYQICIHCNKPTPTNAHLHSFDEDKLSGMIKSAGLTPVKNSLCLNKIANRLHFNLLFKSLPFGIWKSFDRMFNSVMKKPASLIILSVK
jgi:ubiquinone/menaquinone biosynthesis C-methylase UbiE